MRKTTAESALEMHPATTTELTTEGYVAAISTTLRRVYAPVRNAVKTLARQVDADPRAVRGWMSGECGPRGRDLIVLMAECAELRAEVDRLIEQIKGAP